jgi:hypothetical protein
MQQNGSVILHGHLHQPDVNAIFRPGQRYLLIPGGSIHQDGTWVSQRYNYVEYNHQAKAFYIYFRKTTIDHFPQYIRDNDTFPDGAPEGYVVIDLNLLK